MHEANFQRICLIQRFSHFSEYQNPPEGLLFHKLLGCTTRVFDSHGLGKLKNLYWQKVMLMLLTGNHSLRTAGVIHVQPPKWYDWQKRREAHIFHNHICYPKLWMDSAESAWSSRWESAYPDFSVSQCVDTGHVTSLFLDWVSPS